MKIWILSAEIARVGPSTKVFTDESEARAAFKAEVESVWGKYFEDRPMPRNPAKAYEAIKDHDDWNDYIWLTEDELTLPAVYEAGPDLLSALESADGYLQGWYDDDMQEGMGELQSEIEAAMAKAKGEVPRPCALQAAAPDLLDALRTIESYLHRDDNGNAEMYADIFEIIDNAVAKAEGKRK